MLSEVEKCAQNHDIKGLRYIFADCLDVDPTFEKYREDYEFCKSITGFFDQYVELSLLLEDKNKWDMKYWEQLKIDLMKNFSCKRFEHMIQVAQVVYANKISRLLDEREKQRIDMQRTNQVITTKPIASNVSPDSISTSTMEIKKIGEQSETNSAYVRKKSLNEIQEEQLEIKRREQAASYQKQLAEERAGQNHDVEKDVIAKQSSSMGNNDSKKWLGIVVVIIVVVVIVLIIMAIH